MVRRVYQIVFLSLLSILGAETTFSRPVGEAAQGGTALYRAIARSEAAYRGVPFFLVDAVMWVESRYNPAATGGVGEVGLMQIMPSTARMLGFSGSLGELRDPRTNIRLGTRYLAQAWRLAKQDVCTAAMKYRAGHGETRFSVRSVNYCKKVKHHMEVGGYKMAGTIPEPTFGFDASSGRKGPFVLAPKTKSCFARVVQPGPRFGACIPLSKLLKRGLVVNVIRPRKSKKN